MLNCIATDSDPLALELIRTHCQRINFINLKGTFLSAQKALDFLYEESIDLIIIEIKNPEIDAFFMSSIPFKIQIVFITTCDKYAVKSYEFNTTDYILKPVSFDRFYKSMFRCRDNKELIQNKPTNKDEDWQYKLINTDENLQYLFVKEGKKIHRIKINQITYVEADKDYVSIRLINNEKIMIRERLKNILEVLKKHNFIRVHRSFIISFAHINSIEGLTIKIKGHKIPLNKISKEYLLSEFQKQGILG